MSTKKQIHVSSKLFTEDLNTQLSTIKSQTTSEEINCNSVNVYNGDNVGFSVNAEGNCALRTINITKKDNIDVDDGEIIFSNDNQLLIGNLTNPKGYNVVFSQSNKLTYSDSNISVFNPLTQYLSITPSDYNDIKNNGYEFPGPDLISIQNDILIPITNETTTIWRNKKSEIDASYLTSGLTDITINKDDIYTIDLMTKWKYDDNNILSQSFQYNKSYINVDLNIIKEIDDNIFIGGTFDEYDNIEVYGLLKLSKFTYEVDKLFNTVEEFVNVRKIIKDGNNLYIGYGFPDFNNTFVTDNRTLYFSKIAKLNIISGEILSVYPFNGEIALTDMEIVDDIIFVSLYLITNQFAFNSNVGPDSTFKDIHPDNTGYNGSVILSSLLCINKDTGLISNIQNNLESFSLLRVGALAVNDSNVYLSTVEGLYLFNLQTSIISLLQPFNTVDNIPPTLLKIHNNTLFIGGGGVNIVYDEEPENPFFTPPQLTLLNARGLLLFNINTNTVIKNNVNLYDEYVDADNNTIALIVTDVKSYELNNKTIYYITGRFKKIEAFAVFFEPDIQGGIFNTHGIARCISIGFHIGYQSSFTGLIPYPYLTSTFSGNILMNDILINNQNIIFIGKFDNFNSNDKFNLISFKDTPTRPIEQFTASVNGNKRDILVDSEGLYCIGDFTEAYRDAFTINNTPRILTVYERPGLVKFNINSSEVNQSFNVGTGIVGGNIVKSLLYNNNLYIFGVNLDYNGNGISNIIAINKNTGMYVGNYYNNQILSILDAVIVGGEFYVLTKSQDNGPSNVLVINISNLSISKTISLDDKLNTVIIPKLIQADSTHYYILYLDDENNMYISKFNRSNDNLVKKEKIVLFTSGSIVNTMLVDETSIYIVGTISGIMVVKIDKISLQLVEGFQYIYGTALSAIIYLNLIYISTLDGRVLYIDNNTGTDNSLCNVNGLIASIVADNGFIYLNGTFTLVNGIKQVNLARINYLGTVLNDSPSESFKEPEAIILIDREFEPDVEPIEVQVIDGIDIKLEVINRIGTVYSSASFNDIDVGGGENTSNVLYNSPNIKGFSNVRIIANLKAGDIIRFIAKSNTVQNSAISVYLTDVLIRINNNLRLLNI